MNVAIDDPPEALLGEQVIPSLGSMKYVVLNLGRDRRIAPNDSRQSLLRHRRQSGRVQVGSIPEPVTIPQAQELVADDGEESFTDLHH